MPRHFSKRIGRPFRTVVEAAPSSGRKRTLYLECGHTVERYLSLKVPKKVRCMVCTIDGKRARG